MWEAFLLDKNDNFVIELPIERLTIRFKLNDIWTALVGVNYLVFRDLAERYGESIESLLLGGFRIVDIKKDGQTIFRGILSEANVRKYVSDVNLELTFKSWLAYFQKRYITKTYTNTDAGQIAWDLIATAQAEADGDIGITQGVIEPTVNRDRTYKDDEIAKSIIHLSYPVIQNGFDFEISNDKVFSVKARIGTDKPDIVLDEKNIESWNVNLWTGLSLCNRVISRGEGIGNDQVRVVVDAGSLYSSKWYLLEEVRNDIGVKEVATLTDKANAYLELKREPFKTFNVKLRLTNIKIDDFEVGDAVVVKIPDFVDGLYRIFSKEIQYSKNSETISLEFIL